ncbi:hypothetical protein [Gimesia maris]|uniref:DUF1294 domain-containing protein n=1 Tax=Gimesia maris TaxID=122 RepID=A0ABX5YTU2_9PLAN|nr:hypothetical protein [Gimesia maris]EDL56198.1 hypothetical protein PM8797T_10369 [Gimesia maris DSM 8797]QEG19090.1 hypothetical protein GmarT_49870 [Gimesia maris]QGQ28022.1 hypothetical protein F1729_04775 [Gimesia maris]
MHGESQFLKILHVLAVAFTTSVLFLWLNTAVMRLDGMTRVSPAAQSQQFFAQILGALLGLVLGVLSWHHITRKHPTWDVRIIALGCMVFLLVVAVAEELFERLSQFL